MLANYVRLDDAGRAPDVVFARSAAEAEAMIDALAARAGGVRGRVVAAALHRARDLVGLRELPKYWLVTVLAAARASSPRSAPTWRPGAVWRRATTCSS